MIDLHSHFLPDIDDGAKNAVQSIAMLKESFSQGVRLCIATPHATIHCNNDIEEFLLARKRAIALLKSNLTNRNDIPKLSVGAEVYWDNNINQYENIERLCIYGTNALLVEFPLSRHISKYAEEWFYELNRKGIIPVIAHIDRYVFWEEILEKLEGLKVNYQINASKFLSISGRILLRKILKYDTNYIISSDMHNTSTRACNMAAAYKKAKSKYPHIAEDLFLNNAKNILRGVNLF